MTKIARSRSQAGAFVPTATQREEMARRIQGTRTGWLAEADTAFGYAAEIMDSFALEQALLCREECERLRAAAAQAETLAEAVKKTCRALWIDENQTWRVHESIVHDILNALASFRAATSAPGNQMPQNFFHVKCGWPAPSGATHVILAAQAYEEMRKELDCARAVARSRLPR